MGSSYELSDHLSGRGLQHVFSGNADFTGISRERGLFVKTLFQNAFITVDRYGTEAAAITMAMMVGLAEEPHEVLDLEVDRPFVFMIVDEPSGVVLFLGRVMDPSARGC
jgi:serpin B